MNKIGTRIIETSRLILRPMKHGDEVQIFNNYANDERVTRHLFWDAHQNLDVTKLYVEYTISRTEDLNYIWVVELKETNQIIGNIAVVKINEKFLTCEIGYVFGYKWWGNGYCTEALKTVINYMINEVDCHLVEAKFIDKNPASGRVMEKAGMKYEGKLRERTIDKVTKEFCDIMIYSITEEELTK